MQVRRNNRSERLLGALCLLVLATATGMAEPVDFVQQSDPAGILSVVGEAEVGQAAASVEAPAVSGPWRFTGWTDQEGVRQQDAGGAATNPCQPVVYQPTTLTAHYLADHVDEDQDAVPDWFELLHYGHLDHSAGDDTDGDRYDLAEEFVRQTSPHVADPFACRYGEASWPLALFAPLQSYVESGTATQTVTSSRFGQLGDYRFAFWTVNGRRQADALGRALDPVTVAVHADPVVQAQANFFSATEDDDADGLPDWWEHHVFGTLDHGGDEDWDGDGLTLAEEADRDTHPCLPDAIAYGGHIPARSGSFCFTSTGDVLVTTSSSPAGLLDESRRLTIGEDLILSAEAAIDSFRFAGWIVNGIPQRTSLGEAINPVIMTATADMVAQAVYIQASLDADSDTIPDWAELFFYGSLIQNAHDDTDADGYTFAEELVRKTSPRQADPISYRLLERSSPADLLGENQVYFDTSAAKPLSSSRFGLLGVWRFTHWTRNGEPVRDALGGSLDPVPVVFDANRACELTAHYVDEQADTDGDHVPDWLEMRFFGTLGGKAEDDSDLDELTMGQEAALDAHPLLEDSLAFGGLSPARSQGLDFVDQGDVLLRQVSDPVGLVEAADYIRRNTEQTLEAATVYGDYRFVGWLLDAVPQQDSLGRAVNPLTFTISRDTTVTLLLVRDDADADDDLVADWFEWFHYGSLEHGALADTDGDGIHLLEEWIRGTDPHEADPLRFRYLECSQPDTVFTPREVYYSKETAGIFSSSFYGEAAGQRFTHWTVNGARQADALGRALDPARIGFGGAIGLDAMAHFTPTAQDLDQDGVPDWYETHFFGQLGADATLDGDADGLPLAEEARLDTHPALADALRPGGFAPARSSAFNFTYRFYFQPLTTLFVEGLRRDFLSTNPRQATGSFAFNGFSAPALGDWDGDGDLDLLVGGPAGGIRMYENAGSPVIPNLVDRSTADGVIPALSRHRVYPAAGEWSGNGIDDFAMAGGNLVQIYGCGPEFGGFSLVQELAVSGADTVIPEFMDADGDQRLDLIVLLPSGRIRVYLNNGTPVPFGANAFDDERFDLHVPNATGLSAADLDRDGRTDLLVADQAGRIWEFRRQEDQSFLLRSKVWGSTFAGFADGLTVAARDWDGDGDVDLIGGSDSGGLIFYRNPEPHLPVAPPLQTLTTGEQLQLNADQDQAVVWNLIRNDSGAALDTQTGLYHAGPQPGTDCVEARQADGTYGRAWIQVISPAQASASGKALIVAGRRGDGDPVWSAIRHMANTAYAALRQRGLAPQAISYLSHASGDRGVDASPSRQTLQSLLTGNSLVGSSDPSLTLFLVDHGRLAGGEGHFVLNQTESVSGPELNQWLDLFQATHPNCNLTVVIDCCYAGDIARALTTSYPDRRTVVAATTTGQLTHFLADGHVSFSQSFWANIGTGLSLEGAFQDAQTAMAQFQQATLWDPGVLGASALGPELIMGLDRPQIGQISPDLVLQDRDDATIWARDISAAFPVDRVWAVVIPPDYQASGLNPVVDLPEVELAWNEANRRWQAACGGFGNGGSDAPYTVLVYAEDIWDNVSYPRQMTVLPTGSFQRAFIVGASTPEHGSWQATGRLASQAYAICLNRRLKTDDIRLLSDHTDLPGVQAPPTLQSIQDALLAWAPGDGGLTALTVYLVGQGTTTGLALGSGEVLTPALLNDWLGQLQARTRANLNLIVEADYSGIFLNEIGAGGPDRVVMTSRGNNQSGSLTGGGWISFGHWFWSGIARSQNLREAFAQALAIGRSSGLDGHFALDDTGDGLYLLKHDGEQAGQRVLGTAYVTGDLRPQIGLVCPDLTISSGETAWLWAAQIETPDGSQPESVWAEIAALEPDDGTENPQWSLALEWDELSQSYRAVVPDLPTSGGYLAHMVAGSTREAAAVSDPVTVRIYYQLQPQDASAETIDPTLPLLAQGETETAGLATADAPVCYRFLAEPGMALQLDALPTAPEGDLALEILDASGCSLLAVDDWGAGFAEILRYWQAPAAGWHVLKILPGSGLADAAFDLTATLKQYSGPDVYEPDDDPESARPISMAPDQLQHHTFHQSGDQDWMSFFGEAGQSYRIEVSDEGIGCDAELALYGAAGQSLIQTFSWLPGEAKAWDWHCTESSLYWLRARNRNESTTMATAYTVRLRLATGAIPGFVYGSLRDQDGNPLPGQLTLSNGVSMRVLSNGLYFLCLPPGPYVLTLTATGYPPVEATILVVADQILERNAVFASSASQTASLALTAGWNLISLPLVPADPDPEAVLAGVDRLGSTTWAWNAAECTYEIASELRPKRGYWVYSEAESVVVVSGRAESVVTATVEKNWNLVGPLACCPLPINASLVGQPQCWKQGRYQSATQLESGLGYWIYMAQPETLRLAP